ncbi:hypothetical protein NC653_020648 [Populus alba x Populus x berolinensis]|uniref:Uncharacterized protein n=1 Tax=Populus alba x Populus x berolinensis TaxID=444605 RepID=A0AAD6MKY8_9ROSI|nr:hypothetical protein NC653_020648 [Populus alba x Populus x berolinensis]
MMETSSVPFLMRNSSSGNSGGKPSKPSTDDLIRVLEDVLVFWIQHMIRVVRSSLLLARLLLSKPKLVLMDGSTSALDVANEIHLILSIGHAVATNVLNLQMSCTLFEYQNHTLWQGTSKLELPPIVMAQIKDSTGQAHIQILYTIHVTQMDHVVSGKDRKKQIRKMPMAFNCRTMRSSTLLVLIISGCYFAFAKTSDHGRCLLIIQAYCLINDGIPCVSVLNNSTVVAHLYSSLKQKA